MDYREVYEHLQTELKEAKVKREEYLKSAEKLGSEIEVMQELIEPFHKHFGPKEAAAHDIEKQLNI